MPRRGTHYVATPTKELFRTYIGRIKQVPTFRKKRGVLNNAEANNNITSEMIDVLHTEVYKFSPSWAKAQKANTEINRGHPKREAK